ncbi:hypothetical protein LTR56_003092 [Elasticomyces elasticus]|nr:hypothetical protein LTR22_014311 [Elasticomyces elasticus]KAK3656390.1 hypothetical protein LTR56_003092 [Elasticomyces elasticus]KAK4927484.1 hypothetical protein LTR49_005624 [Elasticomyces elasticus]KAK5750125.1 hypothetical protein LTS12_019774 [Elasticomyces elasticus]
MSMEYDADGEYSDGPSSPPSPPTPSARRTRAAVGDQPNIAATNTRAVPGLMTSRVIGLGESDSGSTSPNPVVKHKKVVQRKADHQSMEDAGPVTLSSPSSSSGAARGLDQLQLASPMTSSASPPGPKASIHRSKTKTIMSPGSKFGHEAADESVISPNSTTSARDKLMSPNTTEQETVWNSEVHWQSSRGSEVEISEQSAGPSRLRRQPSVPESALDNHSHDIPEPLEHSAASPSPRPSRSTKPRKRKRTSKVPNTPDNASDQRPSKAQAASRQGLRGWNTVDTEKSVDSPDIATEAGRRRRSSTPSTLPPGMCQCITACSCPTHAYLTAGFRGSPLHWGEWALTHLAGQQPVSAARYEPPQVGPYQQ